MLLSWFLSNLTSESATIRRASTDAAISVCQNSRNPAKYLKVRRATWFEQSLRCPAVLCFVSRSSLFSPCVHTGQTLLNSLFGLVPSANVNAADTGELFYLTVASAPCPP